MMRLGAAVILFSFTFYIAAQFQAAGKTFASVLEVQQTAAIVIGAAVVLVYVWLGGFWAASVTDSVQGLLMALTALAFVGLLVKTALGSDDDEVGDDPWEGQTIEWATTSPAPRDNFVDVPVIQSAEPMLDLRAGSASTEGSDS